jgi:hypothetical protein
MVLASNLPVYIVLVILFIVLLFAYIRVRSRRIRG